DGGVSPPDGGTVACSAINDPAVCRDSGCQVETCPACGGIEVFHGCSDPTGMPWDCAPPICTCGNLDEAACTAPPGRHPVYIHAQACGCARVGCCTRFSRCAEGPAADCSVPIASCNLAPPTCDGPWLVSFDPTGCYEGCVKGSECAEPVVCGENLPMQFPQ